MFEFALHNFRSFKDPGPGAIRPLTIIVGENSTGKSSFLAILRIALEMIQGNLQLSFNRDPFFLGAYDQIAHYRGGRGGRSAAFSFGMKAIVNGNVKDNPQSYTAEYRAQFEKSFAQPALHEISVSCNNNKISVHDIDGKSPRVNITLPSWSREIPADSFDLGLAISLVDFNIPTLMRHLVAGKRPVGRLPERQVPEIAQTELGAFARMWHAALRAFGPLPMALAPVRTKPERTYNPVEERPTPEGSHVPMVMARTFFTDREKWGILQTALNRFGRSSGLFDQISLKTLGRSPSDPFQIMVKTAGPRTNLMDVGYGVSQVLPIIVDLLVSDTPKNYLVQQPEIHLHPRGQAELITFLSTIVKETSNWMVIETHSDYLIDRLRSDIRKGNLLSPEMVSILYFEKRGMETKIHQMVIDSDGNLLNVPETYRQFTLREERKLLGIEDDEFIKAD